AAPSMDERMEDIGAVMDAAGSERAAVFGVSEGGTLSLLFAEAHRERTQALIMYGSWARRLQGPDYPYGPSAAELDEVVAGTGREAPRSSCRARSTGPGSATSMSSPPRSKCSGPVARGGLGAGRASASIPSAGANAR